MKCDLIDCPNPAQEGRTICFEHVAHARGIGSPIGICGVCGKQQRDHRNGFPEHINDLVEAHKVRRNS